MVTLASKMGLELGTEDELQQREMLETLGQAVPRNRLGKAVVGKASLWATSS